MKGENYPMKRLIAFFCMLAICISGCMSAYAVGDGNVDGGGGGMGSGTPANKWIPGEEGVRVTVIRTTDGSQVSSSFDMADFALRDNVNNFGIYSKLCIPKWIISHSTGREITGL